MTKKQAKKLEYNPLHKLDFWEFECSFLDKTKNLQIHTFTVVAKKESHLILISNLLDNSTISYPFLSCSSCQKTLN